MHPGSQPRGNIQMSIVPKDYRVLPADIQGAIDVYFHQQELEDRVEQDPDKD